MLFRLKQPLIILSKVEGVALIILYSIHLFYLYNALYKLSVIHTIGDNFPTQ